MPAQYDAQSKTITLEVIFDDDPALATAALTNRVVQHVLHQNKFAWVNQAEAVDVAVIALGLGGPQCRIELVNDKGTFWDLTAWEVGSSPFLDAPGTAYANAYLAWLIQDSSLESFSDLPNNLQTPAKKSYKYLAKTDDGLARTIVGSEQSLGLEAWTKKASASGTSTKIIALRHFHSSSDAALQQKLNEAIEDALRSGDRELTLHAIRAAQESCVADGSQDVAPGIVDELNILAESGDDLTRAKSIATIGQLARFNPTTISIAAKMLDSREDFVVYSALMALSAVETVDDAVLKQTDRGFKRALQKCNYQFVELFASAYKRWVDDPQAHVTELLETDSPEYLSIALESLQQSKQQLVDLG